jgi:pentose-5-phosphate-3-epimerase
MRHVLVVANETVDAATLREALKKRKGDLWVTVVSPVSQPQRGYVVYSDTRRATARRRLDRALEHLREAGVSADGYVVEADPVAAVRDALATLEPPVDEILVSTHPEEKSGWLRRNVVDRIRSAAGPVPVEHLVSGDGGAEEKNVLVIANETVVGEPLLARIRERNAAGPSSFLIISPQSDPTAGDHPEADRRLKRALSQLRHEGIEVHGQVAHPDPFSAAMEAVHDERVDEIVVSTFEPLSSGWLRKDLVERLRKETGLPVEHVTVAKTETEVPA